MRLLDKDGDVTDKLEEIAALESDDPTKSLWCRLCQALARVFNLLLVVVAGSMSCVQPKNPDILNFNLLWPRSTL